MRLLFISLDTHLNRINAENIHTFSLARHLTKTNKLTLIIGGIGKQFIKKNKIDVITTSFDPPQNEQSFIKFIKLIYNNLYILFICLKYGNKNELIYERCRIGIISGLIYSKIIKIPLIYEINGVLDEEMYEYANINNNKVKKIISSIFKYQLKHANAIIVQTDELKDILSRLYGLKNVFVVENGSEKMRVLKNITNNKEIQLVFVGGLSNSHNLTKIFDTIIEVKENYKFYIIGDGDLREEYIKKYSFDSRLTFLGKLKHKDALTYINNSDICIASYPLNYPTFKKYGFYFCPLKLIEYSSFGKPTLIFSMPNSFINKFALNSACILVNKTNKFKESLILLLKNKKLRLEIGKNAKKISNDFTWSKSALRSNLIFNHVINNYKI